MNKKQKEFTKVFIFLYVVAFILINWNDVSWIFNYREVGGLVYDFFHPYQDSSLLVNADTSINNLVHTNPMAPDPQVRAAKAQSFPYTDKENSLEIPAIGLQTPLVIGQATDNDSLMKDLDKGVVYYPGSVFPGENGQMVILGHSAPPNWPHIKHDWVFSNIENLNAGDAIVLYFDNHQYTYVVVDKAIIPQGQDVGANSLVANNNVLTLVSCWPPGKNYKRIAVEAKLMVN